MRWVVNHSVYPVRHRFQRTGRKAGRRAVQLARFGSFQVVICLRQDDHGPFLIIRLCQRMLQTQNALADWLMLIQLSPHHQYRVLRYRLRFDEVYSYSNV